jgi:PIN domain nuclease of toxin-antitoxin system
MRILLDSHTLLWWMDDPNRINPVARTEISHPRNEVFASAVSIWEIGLKCSKGKLDIPENFADFLPENGIQILPFTGAHAQASIKLPPHHGDPFDRALIAQCQIESLTFATRDSIAASYQIGLLEI